MKLPQLAPKVVLLTGVVVASMTLAACVAKNDETMPQRQAEEPAAVMDTTSEVGVQVVNIEGGAFYYKPNEIKVKKGQKVKIVMKSNDMMHDVVIDELGVKMPVVKSGETGSVEFTPDKVGTFQFYCSVGKHRAQGQVGTLIVE